MEDTTRTDTEHQPEETLSAEDRMREEVDRVLRLVEDGDVDSAVTLLSALHPADRGEALLALERGPLGEAMSRLTPEATAEALEYLDLEEALALISEMEPALLPRVLDETSLDVAADVLRSLPPGRSLAALGGHVGCCGRGPAAGLRRRVSGWPHGAGVPLGVRAHDGGHRTGRATTSGAGCRGVCVHLRCTDEGGQAPRLHHGHEAGPFAHSTKWWRDIMHPEVVSVAADTDQEECARLMERYGLHYLPVLDGDRKLIGIIMLEDVVDVVTEEATEDMFRIAGIAGERVMGPFGSSVRSRPALAVHQPGDCVSGSARDQLLRVDDREGGGARRVPADSGGPGRNCGHADADAGCARHGAR